MNNMDGTMEPADEGRGCAMKTLREAAQAALDALACTGEPDDPGHRCGHCDDYVDRNGPVRAALRAALAQPDPEPLFLLYTGKIDIDGEQDEWDCEADSGKRVEEFCRQHPAQTIKLYAHPPQDDTAALRAEVERLRWNAAYWKEEARHCITGDAK